MRQRPPFSRYALEEAVAVSTTVSQALRHMGLRAAGHNFRTFKKYVELWSIDTAHFDPNAARGIANRRRALPLDQVLVANRPYNRGFLKRRLYREGLKKRECELCGQGEEWRGRDMSLILDHINGRADDNRLENLRIVCPNCAATLDTHCGRNLARSKPCARCGHKFRPRYRQQRYCSNACGGGGSRPLTGVPCPERRKVERPPYDQLLREVEEFGYLATGRRYGVSDNAIRKWIRWYERELERG